MKPFVILIACSLVLIACSEATNQSEKIDTSYTTNVSNDERARQIDNAKYNRTLLPGKWQITDARKEDEQLTKVELADLNFQTIHFWGTDSFSVYHKTKLLDEGRYEWMAEDRELVLTSDDETVQRMLVKKINRQYLKLKFNGTYLTFKRVD